MTRIVTNLLISIIVYYDHLLQFVYYLKHYFVKFFLRVCV